jgi:hypothetical protein
VAATYDGKCLATQNGTAFTKVPWECAEGHVWEAMFSNVILCGTWCPICMNAARGAARMADNLTEGLRLAAAKGGACLAAANFAIRDTVRWRCAEGHEWEAVYYSVRRGSWCPTCAPGVIREKNIADNLTRARVIAEKWGGECLATENFSIKEKAPFRCTKGHEWEATFNNVLNGSWCPRCPNKSETFCHEVLQALFPEHVFRRNVRDLDWLGVGIGGRALELDVYCEELRLALEFNGFLHDAPNDAYGGEEHFKRIQDHDARKVEACIGNEVCLIIVSFAEVSRGKPHIDRVLTAEVIWEAVADLRFPLGAHLESLEDLLAALDL